MRVREFVDAAVLHDAGADSRRESIVQRPLHEVAGDVSDQRLSLLAAQEKVSEMVHSICQILIMPSRTSRKPGMASRPRYRRHHTVRSARRVPSKRFGSKPTGAA